MTITYVAAGGSATGVNASVTPGAITGVAVNDLVLITASIRNSGVGVVNTPAGWTLLTPPATNYAILGRFWQTGDSMPLVTFTGGVANADTLVIAAAWRGVALDQLAACTVATLLNSTSQNVLYPAIDVPGSGHLIVNGFWKQDDSSGGTGPSGFTSTGLVSSTTGDDASMRMAYQIQTAETDLTGGTITITGGATAISRSAVLAFHPAAAITAQTLDLFPPRVLISVTGLSTNDDVAIYRVVGSQRTLVRAGSVMDVTDPSLLRVDAELPFGIPISYVAVVNGTAEYTTSTVTYSSGTAKPVMSDAITGASAEVVILSWPEKTYSPGADVFAVGGRNVVVSGEYGGWTGQIQLYLEFWSGSQALAALVASATEGVVQLRTSNPIYVGEDAYVAVINAVEQRYSQDGSDERRTWLLDCVQVEGWSAEREASGFTYQDVADYYGTATYADVPVEFASYLLLAQGDFS